MSDKYSETTIKSYGERIKSGFFASIFGLILFVLSFVVLFLNEGSSIRTAKMLNAGLKSVISIRSDEILPQNNQKLVHLSDKATSPDLLSDNSFPIRINAIKLERNVEMFQWQEDKTEESDVHMGGSETTTTTYEYKKVWSKDRINSQNFKKSNYANPYPLFASEEKSNKNIFVGKFKLSQNHINRFNGYETLELEENQNLPQGFLLFDGFYTNSKDISNPEIGDLKISFDYIPLDVVSVIGEQNGSQISAFKTEFGDIVISQEGEHSAAEMFQNELKKNQVLTWILRVVGFLMMFIGLKLLIGVIGVIVSVLPFLQPTFSFISTPIIFLFSLCLSIFTIALSWLFYRPLVSVLLFVAIYFIWKKLKKIKANKRQEAEEKLSKEKESNSPLSQMVENSYKELEKKAVDTKDKFTNLIDKFK